MTLLVQAANIGHACGGNEVLTISHDRAFLDTLCTRIIELDEGVVRDYPGDFAWYDEHRGQGRELTIRPPAPPQPSRAERRKRRQPVSTR